MLDTASTWPKLGVERLCRAALDAAAPVGLTSVCATRVVDDRPRGVMWASDSRARRLDDLQVVLGEGPGITALTEGGPVLVPDLPGQVPDSFLAISDLAADARAFGVGLSRVLLTAVGPANRGWHVKLLAETVRRAQAAGHEAVLMTTQATNHAVFRTCEKLGFRLGAISHVLACHSC